MDSVRRCILRMSWSLVVVILALFFSASTANADSIREEDVRTAVETWVRYVTADARPDAVVERMEAYQIDGETVAYIAHLNDKGYCLTGADSLVLPVYLYSPQGIYASESPSSQFILHEIEARLQAIQQLSSENALEIEQNQRILSERAQLWQDLIAGRVPAKIEQKSIAADPDMMVLPLTSLWNQGGPYNEQCPELPPASGNHTVVGCVATAMAQVMRYWEWPIIGIGSDSGVYNYRWRSTWDEESLSSNPGIPTRPAWTNRLEWTASNGGRLRMNGSWDQSVYESALNINAGVDYQNALESLWNRLTSATAPFSVNFGAATYNWNLLQDVHNGSDPVGDVEVAKLSFHAGVVVKMNYGEMSSGAYDTDVDDALRDHFLYDRDVRVDPRNIDTMTEEITWLRPLLLGGNNAAGAGHEWVVYGYRKATDPNRQFLMNMGWRGDFPAWYTWDGVPRGYTIDQTHVTRIAPQNVVRFVGATNPGNGSPDDPYEDVEEAISKVINDATLIFMAGSDNTFSATTLTIDRPLTLKGWNATIRRETTLVFTEEDGHEN